MNKLLFLCFLVVSAIAFLSLRRQKVKFEVEFEMEPKDGSEEDS